MSRKYKIVIFGATGFTGELCARFMSEKYSDIPIAIAGRSTEKLEKIKKTNNLPFPIVVADAFDVNSLEKIRHPFIRDKYQCNRIHPWVRFEVQWK